MIAKQTIRCCAERRCQNPIRMFGFHPGFPCRKFAELIKEGKNPTNCPYYNHMLDRKDIGHNKKSGKGLKRKRKAEQRKKK